MRIKSLLLLVLLFCFSVIQAQVKTNFNNPSRIASGGKFNRSYPARIDFELPARDILSLLNEERARPQQSSELKPFQIAQPVAVDIDMAKQANWTQDGQFAYGKFSIRAKGALSASINFDKFYLPAGTEMYVYNDGGEMITGPITETENNKAGLWGSWVYKGENLNIEIKVPLASKDQLLLHASNIAYGYKEIYRTKVGNFGASGPCNINVLCPLGSGWTGEINSVAIVLDGNGNYLCSGSLLMNSCSNKIPYFLTADHCFINDPSSWRFTFQAWSPTCTPSQNADGITFNGAALRARYQPSDFCLLELNNTPLPNSNIHYAGWNRSSTPATSATGIHHPSGDVMKISRGNNPVFRSSFVFNPPLHHWRVDWSAHDNGTGTIVTAVTEGGSSGSPLFGQDHRVIGQLSGGPSACGNSSPWDFYGSFDISWTGGGSSATRLSDWLDPSGSGIVTTNTTAISALNNAGVVTGTINGSNTICSGSSVYTVTGVPPGVFINWSTSNPSIASVPNPSTGSSVTVTVTSSDPVDLIATLTGCSTGPVQLIKALNATPVIVGGYYQSNGQNPPLTEWDGEPGSFENTVCFTGMPTSTFTNMEVLNATNTIWTKIWPPTFNGVTWSQTDNVNAGIVFKTTNQGIRLKITSTNGCVSTEKIYAFKTVSCAMRTSYQVSPNPASSTVVVSVDKSNAAGDSKQAQQTGFSEIKIFDVNGKLRKQQRFNKANTAVITVDRLEAGVYFIEISEGDHKERKQLLIQK